MGYIAVIDYSAGNIMSVTNTLGFLGYDYKVASKAEDIDRAERIILPGVGAFPPAMAVLREKGLDELICRQSEKKPLLGICLGMQMLFDVSNEISDCEGLGLISGHVRKIETDLKLPHIGWNSLDMVNPCEILEGIDAGSHMYFVHGFCAVVSDRKNLNACADYGEQVAAVVSRENIFGCQFHPEKSGDIGLKIIKNFCEVR